MTIRHIAGAAGALLIALAAVAQPHQARAASAPITCNDYSVGYCATSAHPSAQARWLIAFGNSRAATCLAPIDTDGLYGRTLFALRDWAQAHQQAAPAMDGRSDYLDTLCLRHWPMGSIQPAPGAALSDPRFRAVYSRLRSQMADEQAALRDLDRLPACSRRLMPGYTCVAPALTPAQDGAWTARITDLRTRVYRVHREATGTLAMWVRLNKVYGLVYIPMH